MIHLDLAVGSYLCGRKCNVAEKINMKPLFLPTVHSHVSKIVPIHRHDD
jgi:hypothetical protein